MECLTYFEREVRLLYRIRIQAYRPTTNDTEQSYHEWPYI